jgi:hypothetical protein
MRQSVKLLASVIVLFAVFGAGWFTGFVFGYFDGYRTGEREGFVIGKTGGTLTPSPILVPLPGEVQDRQVNRTDRVD